MLLARQRLRSALGGGRELDRVAGAQGSSDTSLRRSGSRPSPSPSPSRCRSSIVLILVVVVVIKGAALFVRVQRERRVRPPRLAPLDD